MNKPRCLSTLLAAGVLALGACSGVDDPEAVSGAGDHAEQEAGGMTNRLDIPSPVRRNLGITFVRVEARRVEQTLRVPGQFEYLPTARREYRTMLPGRVEVLVDQYQTVEPGTPLYRIESPAWRSLQQEISSTEAAIERAETRSASFGPLREAHHNHEEILQQTIAIRRERVAQLEDIAGAGGGRRADLIEARGQVSTAQAELAEVLETEARLEADEAETRSDLAAAIRERALLLDTAASITHTTPEHLTRTAGEDGEPVWRTLGEITVRAEESGVVETIALTNGAWVDERAVVVSVVDPSRLRFRAVGLQSDLGRLQDGLHARIVAPSPTRAPGSIDLSESMAGELRVGLSGHAHDRTVDLFVTPDALRAWARPGVAAHLEVVTDSTPAPVLAIPRAAVQQDGLMPVFFRRDPKDPNKAIRIEGDLGMNDGRWVEVLSGVRAGDEIVLDGAFQLMLASAAGGGHAKGGHFHADGTFHSDEDHED